MSSRKVPATSKAAYSAVSIEMRDCHFAKIIQALKKLGTASAEQIAQFVGMDHSQINRRVSEMERLEIIFRPGNKVFTKSNRQAFVWQLRGEAMPKTEAQEKILKGKTVSDYSRDILKTKLPIQESLFD